MLSNGYEDVRGIEMTLTNTVGWIATSGQVDSWVYEEANTTSIQDEEMLKKPMDVGIGRLQNKTLRSCYRCTQKWKAKLKALFSEINITHT